MTCSRASAQAAAGGVGHVARGQGRGVGRPDCQHRHDHAPPARSPERAARTANVVAAAFLARERAAEHRAHPVGGEPAERGDHGLEGHARWRGADRAHPRAAERAVRERGDRRLGASARRPGAAAARPPTSPRPLRNAGFAFVAALFIAMLVALGRERIAPRIGEPRELERLTGYPILSEMPESRRFFRDPQGALREREAHEALAAVVAAQLPPQRRQILLLTSPAADEAKARVTAGPEPRAGPGRRDRARDRRRPAAARAGTALRNGAGARARRDPGRRAAGRQRGRGRDDRRASAFGLAAPNRKPGGARRGRGSFTRARDRGRPEDSVRRARPDELLVRDPQRPTDPRLSGVAGLGAPRRRARRRLAAGSPAIPATPSSCGTSSTWSDTPVLGHVVVGGSA